MRCEFNQRATAVGNIGTVLGSRVEPGAHSKSFFDDKLSLCFIKNRDFMTMAIKTMTLFIITLVDFCVETRQKKLDSIELVTYS